MTISGVADGRSGYETQEYVLPIKIQVIDKGY